MKVVPPLRSRRSECRRVDHDRHGCRDDRDVGRGHLPCAEPEPDGALDVSVVECGRAARDGSGWQNGLATDESPFRVVRSRGRTGSPGSLPCTPRCLVLASWFSERPEWGSVSWRSQRSRSRGSRDRFGVTAWRPSRPGFDHRCSRGLRAGHGSSRLTGCPGRAVGSCARAFPGLYFARTRRRRNLVSPAAPNSEEVFAMSTVQEPTLAIVVTPVARPPKYCGLWMPRASGSKRAVFVSRAAG